MVSLSKLVSVNNFNSKQKEQNYLPGNDQNKYFNQYAAEQIESSKTDNGSSVSRMTKSSRKRRK